MKTLFNVFTKEKNIIIGDITYKKIIDLREEFYLPQVSEEERNLIKNIIEKYPDDLYSHSLRVAKLAEMLAKEYGLSESETKNLVAGCLLHDYGKLVNPSLYTKKGIFSPLERDIAETHPLLGYNAIREFPEATSGILNVILFHHERLDGEGYPSGINDIPFYVQISSVCDLYDAIRSKRTYHDNRTHEETMEILQKEPGVNQGIVMMLGIIYKRALLYSEKELSVFDLYA